MIDYDIADNRGMIGKVHQQAAAYGAKMHVAQAYRTSAPAGFLRSPKPAAQIRARWDELCCLSNQNVRAVITYMYLSFRYLSTIHVLGTVPLISSTSDDRIGAGLYGTPHFDFPLHALLLAL